MINKGELMIHYFFIVIFVIIVIYYALKYVRRVDKKIDVQEKTDELRSEHEAAEAVPTDLTAKKVKKDRKKVNAHQKL